jgi:hypothetical protein
MTEGEDEVFFGRVSTVERVRVKRFKQRRRTQLKICGVRAATEFGLRDGSHLNDAVLQDLADIEPIRAKYEQQAALRIQVQMREAACRGAWRDMLFEYRLAREDGCSSCATSDCSLQHYDVNSTIDTEKQGKQAMLP